MSEVVEQQDDVVMEQETVDYKALYEKVQKDLETVAAHKDKLYQETKAAKAEREAAKREAERIAQEKALKDGEFEKLWQKASQEKEELSKRIQEIQVANRNEKVKLSAMQIASKLAEGDNVELLSEFVQRSLDKLADESGALSADVFEAVEKEFAQNAKFKSLMIASKAQGGSAPGNTRSANISNEITRADFAKMDPMKQMETIKKGMKIID